MNKIKYDYRIYGKHGTYINLYIQEEGMRYSLSIEECPAKIYLSTEAKIQFLYDLFRKGRKRTIEDLTAIMEGQSSPHWAKLLNFAQEKIAQLPISSSYLDFMLPSDVDFMNQGYRGYYQPYIGKQDCYIQDGGVYDEKTTIQIDLGNGQTMECYIQLGEGGDYTFSIERCSAYIRLEHSECGKFTSDIADGNWTIETLIEIAQRQVKGIEIMQCRLVPDWKGMLDFLQTKKSAPSSLSVAELMGRQGSPVYKTPLQQEEVKSEGMASYIVPKYR